MCVVEFIVDHHHNVHYIHIFKIKKTKKMCVEHLHYKTNRKKN